MNERAFKLDFFLALVAVVLSIITTIGLIYQTAVMRDQYAATVWPYLSVDSSYDGDGMALQLTNDGFGPALVKSAALTVDGKAAKSWDDLLRVLFIDPLLRPKISPHMKMQLTQSSLDGASIIRPSQSLTIFRFEVPDGHAVVIKHTVDINLCYCSLNGSCWMLHATPGRALGNSPQPTSHCDVGAKIDSPVEWLRLSKPKGKP